MTTEIKILSLNEMNGVLAMQMFQLRSAVFVVEQQCIYLDIDEKDADANHLLLFENNELAAYCRILDKGVSYANYCSIGRVVVSAKHRRKNYGKLIMQQAVDYCLKNFDAPIKISAQAYLEHFYYELGFETIGESYLEDDIPHLPMLYKA